MNYIVNIESPHTFQDLLKIKRWFDGTDVSCYNVSKIYVWMLQEGKITHRPGFKFYFWFVCKELADRFKNDFDGEFVVK